MIEKRNITSHTYNEDTANEIVQAIRTQYFQAFIDLRVRLKALIEHE